MSKFIVKFPTPVRYLMDHPRGQRDVLELIVNAPTPNAALAHAIRTTNGDPGEMQVVEYYEAPIVPIPVEDVPVEVERYGDA